MLPSLSELIYWTGLTVFELWLHATSLFVFLIVLPLKIHQVYVMSYWLVFSPLFIASSFNSYFVFIIFVRSVFEYKDFKGPALNATIKVRYHICCHFSNHFTFRFGFNMMRLALIALFEVLLCYKIEGDFEHGQVAVRSSYGIVFTPVWILFLALCIQTCRLF
ncbi:hypothetical protein ANCDUO_01784 [Ancylostoma duodenale]|uniref:Uncharacterized protein n=1 Tax=Ancylostoma duodenale TaxID=51022 RepID=A0A0C2HEC8_9BILA|nr:hypothetical protein ANCDUO_01784 [Ancylostoma duodenale]